MTQALSWDEECDVLVAGSGGGALTGAYTAAREGLDVLVVEATDRFGGTTAYSGGGMWLPCNAVLRRAGDDDTLEDARTYYRAVVGDRTPQALQDAFLDTGAPLVDYLEQDDAFAFQVLPWPDYFGAAPKARAGGRHIIPTPLSPDDVGVLAASLRDTVPTERAGHAPAAMLTGGRALIGRLLLALSGQASAELRLNAPLRELVREDGRVVGAVVHDSTGPRRIRARRGVVLAAGGFEANQALRDRYQVPGRATDSMGAPGNLGEALEAAVAVGASTDLMTEAWWSPGVTHPDGSSSFSLWFTGGVFVDQAGRRFVNESLPYDRIGRVVLERQEQEGMTLPFWMVYDDRDGPRPPVRATTVPMGETEEYRRAGLWHTADTLAELGQQIGVPAQALVDSIERFNAFVAAGRDEDFGRGEEAYDRSFSGGRSPLVHVAQGPFHAAAFGLSDLGTKGGLRTDAHARVLDEQGAVIPGLYAAGNTQAAVSGTTYPGGGNPIASCMVFAHLAALDLAQQV